VHADQRALTVTGRGTAGSGVLSQLARMQWHQASKQAKDTRTTKMIRSES